MPKNINFLPSTTDPSAFTPASVLGSFPGFSLISEMQDCAWLHPQGSFLEARNRGRAARKGLGGVRVGAWGWSPQLCWEAACGAMPLSLALSTKGVGTEVAQAEGCAHRRLTSLGTRASKEQHKPPLDRGTEDGASIHTFT